MEVPVSPLAPMKSELVATFVEPGSPLPALPAPESLLPPPDPPPATYGDFLTMLLWPAELSTIPSGGPTRGPGGGASALDVGTFELSDRIGFASLRVVLEAEVGVELEVEGEPEAEVDDEPKCEESPGVGPEAEEEGDFGFVEVVVLKTTGFPSPGEPLELGRRGRVGELELLASILGVVEIGDDGWIASALLELIEGVLVLLEEGAVAETEAGGENLGATSAPELALNATEGFEFAATSPLVFKVEG